MLASLFVLILRIDESSTQSMLTQLSENSFDKIFNDNKFDASRLDFGKYNCGQYNSK